MKFLSFYSNNEPRLGVQLDSGVLDLQRLNNADLPGTMEALLNGGEKALKRVSEAVSAAEKTHLLDLAEIEYAPVVSNPEKILGVGLNYRKHVLESTTPRPIPEYPVVFAKFKNSLVGHKGKIILNRRSKENDYEAEMAIVIGKRGAYIPKEEAMDHVFGYTLANDVSSRDLQYLSYNQWGMGKTCDTYCPLGPCLVTKDELDGNEIHMIGKLNGEIRQDTNTNDMIFSVEDLVSFCSDLCTLEPGDVILTGTPSGVVHWMPKEEQEWLKPGDVFEVIAEGIGTLSNEVVAG